MADGRVRLSVDAAGAVNEVERLANSFSDLNNESKEVAENVNKAFKEQSRDAEKAVRENNKQLGILEKLNKELTELRKKRQQANNVSDIKKYNSEIKETEKSIQSLTNETKELAESTEEVSKGGGGIAGVFQNISAGALGVVAGVTAVIAGLTRAFQFIRDRQRTESVAKQLFGSDSEFQDIARNAREISAIYDKEVNEVLQSASTLSREFGIEQEKAFQLISDGIDRGADLNEDFLDQIREYSTQFRAAGLSADQSIALITQSVNEGVFSDKGADAIKEATLRLREFTPATRDAINAIGLDAGQIQKDLQSGARTYFDVIQEVSGTLGEFGEQSQQAGQVLADVFGGAGEDAGRFIFGLSELPGTLSEIEDNTGSLEKAQRNLIRTWNNFIEDALAGEGALSGVFSFLLNLASDFIVVIQNIFESVAPSFRRLGDAFQSLFSLFNAGGESTINLAEILTFNLRLLGKALSLVADFIALVVNSFVGLVNSTKEFISESEFLTGVVNRIRSDFNSLISAFRSLPDTLLGIGSAFTEFFRLVGDQFKAFADIGKSAFTFDIDGVRSGLSDLGDTFTDGGKRISDAFNNAILDRRSARQKIVEDQLAEELEAEKSNNKKVIDEDKKRQAQITQQQKEEARKRREEIRKQEEELQKEIASLVSNSEVSQIRQQEGEDRIFRERELALREIQILEDTLLEKNNKLTKDGEERIKREQEILEATSILTEEVEQKTNESLQKLRDDALEKRIEDNRKAITEENQLLGTQLAILEQQIKLNDESTEAGAKSEVEFLKQKIALISQEVIRKKQLIDLELQRSDISDVQRDNLNAQKELLTRQGQVQVQNINNSINAIEQGAEDASKLDSILGKLFGIDDPSEIDKIKGAFLDLTNNLVDIYRSGIENQLEQNQKLIDSYDENISKLESILDEELELQEKGEANRVDLIRGQIDAEEAARDEALEKQQELQRRQAQLDRLEQVSSLITASANIFQSLSGLGPVGIALATASVAALFAGFIQAQRQASQIANTQFADGGLISVNGDSAKMVSGKRHSQGGEMLLDHAEVESGEMVAVFSRSASAKNASKISQLVDGLNRGKSFESMMTVPKVNLNTVEAVMQSGSPSFSSVDMSKTESKLDAIYQVLKDRGDISETSTHIIYRKGSTVTKVKK